MRLTLKQLRRLIEQEVKQPQGEKESQKIKVSQKSQAVGKAYDSFVNTFEDWYNTEASKDDKIADKWKNYLAFLKTLGYGMVNSKYNKIGIQKGMIGGKKYYDELIKQLSAMSEKDV